jgi:hypothetical protein
MEWGQSIVPRQNQHGQCCCGKRSRGEIYREISRAIRKAAPAATPPISAVCSPLRIGLAPVKRPLTFFPGAQAHA